MFVQRASKFQSWGGPHMRIVTVIVTAVLILGRGSGPVLAQTHQGGSPALAFIQMIDAMTGWALTDQPDANALLLTPDGGIHWIDVTPLNSSGQRVSVDYVAPLTSLIAWVVSYAGIDPEPIFHTADGQTWRSATTPPLVGSVHFIDAQNGWRLSGVGAAGSMEADIYRSTDGGATWTKVASTTAGNESSGLPFAGDKGDVTFLNATTGWVTGTIIVPNWLYLYVTHDGGSSWRQQTLPLPPQVTFPWDSSTVAPKFFGAQDGILPVFYRNRDTNAWLVAFYVTHDGGTTWTYTTPVSSTREEFGPWSFADVVHGWVAGGDTLYVTTDGGSHWTKIPPSRPFTKVNRIDFISPQIGWAVTPASLLKTENGGRTWTPVVYTILR